MGRISTLLAGCALLLVTSASIQAQEILWTQEDADRLQGAQAALNSGESLGALSVLDELLLRYPASPVVERLRGHALEALERNSQAREAFVNALAGGAFSTEVLSALLRLDFALERLPAALSSSRLLLLLEPDNAQYAQVYGDLLLQGGQFAAAEVIYNSLRNSEAFTPALFERLGRAAFAGGRRRTALAQFESAYYLGSSDPELTELLSRLWLEAGDEQRARLWNQRGTGNTLLEAGLTAVQRAFQRADFKAAERAAMEVEAKGTPADRAQAAAWRGRIARAQHDDASASRHFRRAIDGGLVDADLLAFLGSEAFNDGRMQAALDLLARAWDVRAQATLLPFLVRAAIDVGDLVRCDLYLVELLERFGMNADARELIARRAALID